MKCPLRILLGASLILLIPLFFLSRHLLDLWDQYNGSAYMWASISHGTQGRSPPIPAIPGDKIIVMAKLEQENTDWVAEYLPEYTPFPPFHLHLTTNPAASWQRAIYTVNPSSSDSSDHNTLTTSLNKGHESMAYLTYIIDHYASLPSTLAFLHSHASGFLCAWHTDTPLHSNIDSLDSLQIPFAQQNGYVNLRCNWNPGCLAEHRYNKHITPEVWHAIFDNASISQFSHRDDKGFVPEQVGTACCAQFAVSRERVLERPRSDYEGFMRWVVETGKSDAQSGRVMEFLWHVIFGMDAI